MKNELSTAMQQNQQVVAQGSNLRSQAENVIGMLESELKQELPASRMTREQDADVVRNLSFRYEAAEESQQNLIAQMRTAAEQRFAFQADEHRIEIEKLETAATHDKEITAAMLESQARLPYTQPMIQNRTNLTETKQSLADRTENAVASLNRLHSEEINKVVADYKRQLAAMDDMQGKRVGNMIWRSQNTSAKYIWQATQSVMNWLKRCCSCKRNTRTNCGP